MGMFNLRHPGTFGEMRQAANPELREYIRGKRSLMNLPTAWDDVSVGRERGWKAQRRGRKAWDR